MMKKTIKIFSFIFLILLLTGCGKEKYVTCTIDVDNTIENYQMTGTYKIYYSGNYVTRIQKLEQYVSQDKDMIDYFDEYKNLEYYKLNDFYDGFEYSVDKQEESVTLDATIDMNVVDLKKMVKDKYLDEDYVISNRLTVSGIKRFYKVKGASCDI